jgi:hypothetical protein
MEADLLLLADPRRWQVEGRRVINGRGGSFHGRPTGRAPRHGRCQFECQFALSLILAFFSFLQKVLSFI